MIGAIRVLGFLGGFLAIGGDLVTQVVGLSLVGFAVGAWTMVPRRRRSLINPWL